MRQDVASLSKPLIDNQIGSYNRNFAKKMIEYLNANKIEGLKLGPQMKELRKIWTLVKPSRLQPGYQKLSLFSEYLSGLDNNDFYNPQQYIEVPG